MTILDTQLNARSADFLANAAAMRTLVNDIELDLAGVHADHAIDAAFEERKILLGDDHRALTDVDLAQRGHESHGDLGRKT